MKNKYFIEFDSLEQEMSTTIQISKEQFFNNLKFLHEQVKNTQDDEYSVNYLNTYFKENEQLTETRYVFSCGTADTRLIHQQCKNGFKFKKKGE